MQQVFWRSNEERSILDCIQHFFTSHTLYQTNNTDVFYMTSCPHTGGAPHF